MEENIQAEPARTGFYWARTERGEQIAKFQSIGRGSQKTREWLQYVSDDPSQEKQPRVLHGVTGFRKATQAEVDAALTREPSIDEQCDRAYDHFISRRQHRGGYLRVNQATQWRYKSGDAVRVGMLENCRVVKVYDEGQVLAVQVTRRENDAVTRGIEAWSWLEVEPDSPAQTTRKLAPVRDHVLSFASSSVESLLNRVVHWNIDDKPKYQRGYAWTLEDKRRLIQSALAGLTLGKVILVKRPFPKAVQLLDGKQRINALLEFVAGQFDVEGLHWAQLHKDDRRAINEAQFMTAEINEERVDEVFILRTFLEVNAAGVPQSEEHLALVREQLREAINRKEQKQL